MNQQDAGSSLASEDTTLSSSPVPTSGLRSVPPCRFLSAYPSEPTRLRLFCFPPAGGGTAIFNSWPAALPPGVEVCPVYLPGRERRVHERPFKEILPLAQVLSRDLLPYLEEIDFAFFGYSMGALLAYELACDLRQVHGPTLRHVFVAACQPPHLFKIPQPISHLPKEELTEALRSLNLIPEKVAQHAELLEVILPIFSADIAACETYVYQKGEPLECFMTAYGGREDRSVDQLGGWAQHTRHPLSYELFPGDHFFVQRAQTLLLKRLDADLRSLLEENSCRSSG